MKYRLPRNIPFVFLFLTICLVLILHVLGINFYLYWRIAGYDRLVHILSSFWATFTLLVVFAQSSNLSKKSSIIIALAISLVVGLAWEYFELTSGFTRTQDPGFLYDTIADMIADIVGGIIGGGYFLGKYYQVKQNELID